MGGLISCIVAVWVCVVGWICWVGLGCCGFVFDLLLCCDHGFWSLIGV